MDIRFSDHSSFHRAAAGMVGGSILFGSALHAIAPHAAYGAIAGGVLGIGAGAAFAYGKPAIRLVGAAVAAAPFLILGPMIPWGAVFAAAALLGLVLALDSPHRLLAIGVGALATVTAFWCANRIGFARETISWPGWLRATTSAGAVGMVGILAMLPRHLSIAIDPVASAVRRLPAGLDPEVAFLCKRAAAIWQSSRDLAQGRDLVRDGVLKTIEVAAKSVATPIGATPAELEARMAELDARIAAATDDEVRAQYTSARAALGDQQRYHGVIKAGRERLVARMHNHIAALEKFQLAATGLAAAAAGVPEVKQLEALSHDVATSGEALVEAELAATA
ncbi:MAG TPA: hypothetical protein VGM88_26575 [Kofleriaceae bacterium]|jgi:hypothetical protein